MKLFEVLSKELTASSPVDLSKSHGHVTPTLSPTGEQIKAKCMGPGRCPVCNKELEEHLKSFGFKVTPRFDEYGLHMTLFKPIPTELNVEQLMARLGLKRTKKGLRKKDWSRYDSPAPLRLDSVKEKLAHSGWKLVVNNEDEQTYAKGDHELKLSLGFRGGAVMHVLFR